MVVEYEADVPGATEAFDTALKIENELAGHLKGEGFIYKVSRSCMAPAEQESGGGDRGS